MSKNPIRVVVIDDHPTFRSGLRALLESEGDIVVVAEAEDAASGRVRFVQNVPDVTIVDLQLPDGDGEDLIAEFVGIRPDAITIALTSHQGPETIKRTLAAGARGYVFKDTARIDIVSAVRNAHQGRRVVKGEVAERLAEAMLQDDLTPREFQVLKIMAEGLGNKEIARRCEISEATVKLHVGHILSKLGARSRTEAILMALQSGLIRLR